MAKIGYFFLTLAFGCIGYFAYNAALDIFQGTHSFVTDSTRMSHALFVIICATLFLGVANFAVKSQVKSTDTSALPVNLPLLTRRFDNIEDRVQMLEELTHNLTEKGVLTRFNPSFEGETMDLLPPKIIKERQRIRQKVEKIVNKSKVKI